MKCFKIIIFSLILIVNSVFSQPIVDIEELRHSDEIGYFGSAGLNLNSSRGNENRDDFSQFPSALLGKRIHFAKILIIEIVKEKVIAYFHGVFLNLR